ncbi:hypothetical protein [Undibacterium pigrum]|uniref:Uncharacterized protein n=1 Tax=Undibacterium pigrum TaxID=401470 RepID=A0A318J1V2_9BURK|nr:hypothetical protein [Undibacterium pigrum]PXX41595.1 hypothetical protein DFR42_107246 [Undibacterium pigrum]
MSDPHAITTPPTLNTALPDNQVAIQGLQHALQAIQDEITRQGSLQEQYQQHKRQLLESQVARLLPVFSGAVLDALVLACPGFVDDVVRAAFRDNRKILGLFARPGAAIALTSLQVRLAFFLDQQKGPEIRSADLQIANASDARQKLEKLHYETQTALQTLASYQASGQSLPADVQAYVRQLAERARQIVEQPQQPGSTHQDNSNTSQQHGYDHGAYPWLYYSHDIGQNFSHVPAAAVATGAVTATAVTQHRQADDHAAPAYCPPDMGNQSDTRDALACRTDDSLGAYS